MVSPAALCRGALLCVFIALAAGEGREPVPELGVELGVEPSPSPASDVADYREPFDTSTPAVYVAVIASAFSAVFLLLLLLCAQYLYHKRVKLLTVTIVTNFACVMSVGLLGWVVTYTTTRASLGQQLEKSVTHAGEEVAMSVAQYISSGLTMLHLLEGLRGHSVAFSNSTFPDPHKHFQRISAAFRWVDVSGTPTSVYYGDRDGYFIGVTKGKGFTESLFAFPADAPENPYIKCDSADPLASNASYAHCADGRRNILVDWNGTLPPSMPLRAREFDPRTRPWYEGDHYSGRPLWQRPYLFKVVTDSAHLMAGLGFTITLGVKDAHGEPQGVFAVDYEVGELAVQLAALVPTPNAHVHVATTLGDLLSSSAHPGVGVGAVAVEQVLNNTHAAIRDAFLTLVEKHGSLKDAARFRSLIQTPRETMLFALPLPLVGIGATDMVGGFTTLVVVEVPLADVLSDPEFAADVSLSFVLGCSVLLSVLLAMVMMGLIPSVKSLAADMQHVAWLETEQATSGEARQNVSSIAEIAAMQRGMALVVENMGLYKQYLPEPLVPSWEDSDAEGHSDVDKDFGVFTLSETMYKPGRVPGRQKALSVSDTPRAPADRISFTLSTKNAIRSAAVFSRGLEDAYAHVLTLNTRRLHEDIDDQTLDATRDHLGMVFGLFQRAAREHKGVIESLTGGRCCVSFNASRRCAAPYNSSALMAVEARDIFRGAGMLMTCGGARGQVRFGSIGVEQLHRHCIFGAAVTQSAVLERLAKAYTASCAEASIVFSQRAALNVSEVTMSAFDYVPLPCELRPNTVLFAAGDRRAESDPRRVSTVTDWMYLSFGGKEQASAARKITPSDVFAAMADRQLEIARDLFDGYLGNDDNDAAPSSPLDVLGVENLYRLINTEGIPRDLGWFYTNAILWKGSPLPGSAPTSVVNPFRSPPPEISVTRPTSA